MALRRPTLGLAAVTVALALAACTGSSASSPPAGSEGPGTGVAAPGGVTSVSGGNTGGGGGLPAGACALLSTAEIQQTLGVPVKDGVEQDTDSQVNCQWGGAADESIEVGLTIATFDDTLWQAGSDSTLSTKVDGIGEAAYKGWPTPAALNIKDKGYLITMGIVDFRVDQPTVDQANETLAKLVLGRL